MITFIKNGIKEAFVSAILSKQKVGSGCVLFYLCDICWSFVIYGARPRDYVMFEFYYQNHRRRNQCFTTFRFFRLMKKLDKLTESYKLNSNKEHELRLFAPFIKRKWICVNAATTKDEIYSFVEINKKVIVKPNGGTYGKDIFIINGVNDANINILLEKSASDKFIMEEVVENVEELARFNRSSLNTFRVYTFIDKTKKCNVLAVMLRIGKKGAVVDNWGAGGIGYNFDIKTGVCDQPGRDKSMNQYIYHPGTNYLMLGYKLPCYDDLLKYVNELANVVPEAKYVGWDIALTPKGFDLIEMNCPGGNDFLQAFGNYYYDYIKSNW